MLSQIWWPVELLQVAMQRQHKRGEGYGRHSNLSRQVFRYTCTPGNKRTWRRLRLRWRASATFLMGRASMARMLAFSASTSSFDSTAGGLPKTHVSGVLIVYFYFRYTFNTFRRIPTHFNGDGHIMDTFNTHQQIYLINRKLNTISSGNRE